MNDEDVMSIFPIAHRPESMIRLVSQKPCVIYEFLSVMGADRVATRVGVISDLLEELEIMGFPDQLDRRNNLMVLGS
jgi:hypothetical protein